MSSSGTLPCSIRLNPFKSFDTGYLGLSSDVPWSPYGHYLKERISFTLDPFFQAGAYYVQDAAAMFTGELLRRVLPDEGGLKVLDLCAAPGGKSTDAAASLREKYGNDFLLVSNEVIHSRVALLYDNMAKWGDPDVVVTSADAAVFGKRCGGMFDIIIADVPCSGEAMFRKNEKAVENYSEGNVALCAARQKRILSDIWPALKDGGILIYSTCTFNDFEDDGNVAWAAAELGADVLKPEMPWDEIVRTEYGFSLTPDKVAGEGQYVAALRKKEQGSVASAKTAKSFDAFLKEIGFRGEEQVDEVLRNDYEGKKYPAVDVDRKTALQYFHRDALTFGNDVPTGLVALYYGGLPIGMVKNLGKRANNLLPMRRRILMNV